MDTFEDAWDFPGPDELPSRPAYPDPLETFGGEPVTDEREWVEKRRPELYAAFQHYVYGYLPPAPDVEWEVVESTPILDGDGFAETVRVTFESLGAGIPGIQLAVFRPDAADAVPVVLGTNKAGNQTVIEDPAIPASGDHAGLPPDERAEYGDRGERSGAWAIEDALDRGYAIATFHAGDIEPDDPDADGIRARYPDPPGPPASQWGTLAAWAWGLHRGVDYLREADAIDRDAIGVIGHSRRGKAALLAGALDERIAFAVPHQSGTGGCALSRNNDQETVARITEVFPHWFADRFASFADREERLPVDQHLLCALLAPRPLLDTEGTLDHWANPPHALRALRAADPVYDLLDVDGLIDAPIGPNEPITADNAGRLVQYRRETEHVLDAGYWNAVFDFADVHLD